MTLPDQHSSREEVLDAFSMEEDGGSQTLARYLRQFPEYADDLLDLSRELHRTVLPDESELSEQDQARIEAAWQEQRKAAPKVLGDQLAMLSVGEMREAAAMLGIPRQVLTGFRERRVILDSVPKRFLGRLAAAIKRSIDELMVSLAAPRVAEATRNYKADGAPRADAPITFEQLLIDAGVSEDKRAQLMTDDE